MLIGPLQGYMKATVHMYGIKHPVREVYVFRNPVHSGQPKGMTPCVSSLNGIQ